MDRVALAVLLILGLVAWTTTPDSTHPGRNWHNVRITEFADFQKSAGEAHVCTMGLVREVRKEQDGDWHIRLEVNQPKMAKPTAFVILEIIPELPMAPPRVGQMIQGCGIIRHDGKHGWEELHPLLTWEIVT